MISFIILLTKSCVVILLAIESAAQEQTAAFLNSRSPLFLSGNLVFVSAGGFLRPRDNPLNRGDDTVYI